MSELNKAWDEGFEANAGPDITGGEQLTFTHKPGEALRRAT